MVYCHSAEELMRSPVQRDWFPIDTVDHGTGKACCPLSALWEVRESAAGIG